MQSHTLITKIIVCISTLFLNAGCNEKKDSENQITITIRPIDSKTKRPRINMFDTIVIRKQGIGYLIKTFNKVGEYITDSTGTVNIKVDSTKIYDISVFGLNGSGGEIYYPGNLKNGQEVDIEIIPTDK